MKKIFLLFLFIVSLFAMSKSEILEQIKQNPSLLNTPQAQIYLKKYGITKEQALAYINGKKLILDNEKNFTIPSNNIEISDVNESQKLVFETNETNKTNLSEYNPFKYIPANKLIKKIQSIQQKQSKVALKRFGEKFFYNKNSLNKQNLAVPEYYQLNVGDIVEVEIFGGNDKTLTLNADNNGNITLPVIGPINVAGLSVSEVKDLIKQKLKPTYPNSKIIVNVKVNSFIQVSLTGYVQAPGVYNLNSLSTVKDLLIAANGFGAIGSMREVYLKRNGKTIKIIDFYKLIKDGELVDNTLLRNGDVIYVPKAKILVSLSGAAESNAIFEMK